MTTPTIEGIQFQSVRAMLLMLLADDKARYRLQIKWPNGLGSDTIAVHVGRLCTALAALPGVWDADITDHEGRAVIHVWWEGTRHGVKHRGQLYLHACGSPEYGPKVAKALEYCASSAAASDGWRVGQSLPRELWPAVSGIFGAKKYANQSGAQAAAMIKAYGWRNYTDAEVTL